MERQEYYPRKTQHIFLKYKETENSQRFNDAHGQRQYPNGWCTMKKCSTLSLSEKCKLTTNWINSKHQILAKL